MSDDRDPDEKLVEDDNICPACDSTGTDENGHLCKVCQGKGYLRP